MFVVGVDENGLGPRLGPLIVTAAVIEVDRYRPQEHRALGQTLGVYDSKATSGFGKMAAVEGIALALLERLRGPLPRDVDQLLHSLCWQHPDALRSRCPARSQAQCWSEFVELPVFGGQVDRGRQVLDRLTAAGVSIRSVRSAVICSSLLNAEARRLGSKLLVDLSLFERLMIEARSLLPQDIEAFCGKVGGMDKYTAYFRHLTGYVIEEQARARSCYRVAGLGRVAFEIDADANHLPVGLASIIGKYVREVLMERQNRFYLANDPSLRRVSGYHDRLTADFVATTHELRRKLGIAEQCFERC